MKHHYRLISLLLFLIFALTACDVSGLSQTQAPTQVPQPTALTEPTRGTRISQIQGAQHRSPLEGQTVSNMHGIVTALTGNGFYLQDLLPDQDERTSEGIFIATNQIGKAKVGDEVLVSSGVVNEFNRAGIGENSLTLTEIQTPVFSVLSSGNPLPTPVILGQGGGAIPNQIIEDDVDGYAGRNGLFDPQQDGLDFYESLEGMRVQVNDAVAISSTSQYREVVIVADGGKDATILSSRGTLVLRENDYNPERILIDDSFINLPDILVGARFTRPIVGIISYDFGNFRLQPTEKLKFTQGALNKERALVMPEPNQLAIATYNVENLDAQTNPERLDQLAEDIVTNLRSPDILALQEIQDDDGALNSSLVSAEITLKALTAAIQQADGPEYAWLSIDPQRNADGGVLGGNIRTVLFYRTDCGLVPSSAPAGDAITAVQVIEQHGSPQLSLNPGRISPASYAFRDSRKPLVAQFSFRGEDIFIIANHLNSKGEDGALYGDIQPPLLLSETQRIQQANIIHDFMLQILAADPQASIVVLGDLNDFPWSEPVQTLAGKQLKNLIDHLPENERYTYIFEGNAEVLDHILVSQSLAEKMVYFDIVHINTEILPWERLSDHDPVIAIFDFEEGNHAREQKTSPNWDISPNIPVCCV